MKIRKAENKDIEKVMELLSDVLEIHAKLRPDIFIPGTTKYTRKELETIFKNPLTPVFVAVEDDVIGYAFCIIESQPFSTNMKNIKTCYIDDLCVDKKAQRQSVGKQLFEYVQSYAKEIGCYNVTLNVWEGNESARIFYEKMGLGVKKTQMELILK